MSKQKALRQVIREEIQLLNESFEGNVRDRDYRELLDALEDEFGKENVGKGPDDAWEVPVWFRNLGQRWWTVKVDGVDNAERVQNIADRQGINLDLS